MRISIILTFLLIEHFNSFMILPHSNKLFKISKRKDTHSYNDAPTRWGWMGIPQVIPLSNSCEWCYLVAASDGAQLKLQMGVNLTECEHV